MVEHLALTQEVWGFESLSLSTKEDFNMHMELDPKKRRITLIDEGRKFDTFDAKNDEHIFALYEVNRTGQWPGEKRYGPPGYLERQIFIWWLQDKVNRMNRKKIKDSTETK